MAEFYLTGVGSRGTTVTKTGTSQSGIKAAVQSWNGSLITSISKDENNQNIFRLEIGNGSTTYGDVVFRGTLDELRAKLAK